ncbi:OX-2 membrane glycoprotein [Pogona vitticeps]|nr:OX-2 membrane glycoprotein-like [Pogona vitticeps]
MHAKVNDGKYSLWTFQRLSLCIILVELCRTHEDISTQDKDVELGGNVTLSCTPTKHYDTVQVTWQEKTDQGIENMAVYNKTGGNVLPPYKHRIRFVAPGLNDTAITFWNVSIQDNGCYYCIFNTYPLGPISGNPCLSVYDHLQTFLHYQIFDGHLNASCIATGFPRPNISWVASGAEKNEKEVTNPNGTVSVISSILVNVSSLKQQPICRVTHRREETDLKIPEAERGYLDPVVLTVLVLIIVVILVIIAVCCWRRHRKKRSGF